MYFNNSPLSGNNFSVEEYVHSACKLYNAFGKGEVEMGIGTCTVAAYINT